LPPFRSRPEDVPELAWTFIQSLCGVEPTDPLTLVVVPLLARSRTHDLRRCYGVPSVRGFASFMMRTNRGSLRTESKSDAVQ